MKTLFRPLSCVRFLAMLPVLCLLPLSPVVAAGAVTDAQMMASVTAAAHMAQQRCYEFMHEDADEYLSCLNALDGAVKGKSASANWQRLGISYFGWVGANNSARVSLPGADGAAVHFLLRFRKWQRQLGIADDVLCQSVAGDCPARLAQIAVAEHDLKLTAKATAKAASVHGKK